MDFVEGMISFHQKSSSDSSPFSMPLVHGDPSIYASSQSSTSNLTASPKPYRQEANNQPLPNYRGWWDELNWIKTDTDNFGVTSNVEFLPIIEHDEPVKREEFSFWESAFSDMVHAHKESDLNWYLRTLVTNTLKDANAEKNNVRIHNNQPKFRLTKEVAAPDPEVAQTIINQIMISIAEMRSLIGNLEAQFSPFIDLANQLSLQSLDPKSRVMQLTSVKELSGAICIFMDVKKCWLDVNGYMIRVIAEIRRFNVAIEDLETHNVFSNDLVMELRIVASNLELQITQLFVRVYACISRFLSSD